MLEIAFAAAMAVCPPTGTRTTCVHDGDTVWIGREKIRLADIDAPEIKGRCPYEKALAIKARNRLVQLLRRPYRIYREGEDRYGRTLAVITVDGRSVGDVLVAEGLARTWAGRREPWC